MIHAFLTFCCLSRSEVFAKNVSAFADNVSVYFFRRPRRQSRLSHIIYCFISLKPASTVFPPNCHSNFRFGVTKSLWKSRSNFTLVTLAHIANFWVWNMVWNKKILLLTCVYCNPPLHQARSAREPQLGTPSGSLPQFWDVEIGWNMTKNKILRLSFRKSTYFR
jgi:hypothetical protein